VKKRIVRKLKNNSGESIAETLVAVLIAAFALLMLAGTINTASNLITNSKNRLKVYYDENNRLASGTVGDSRNTITMNEKIGGKTNWITCENVGVYENDELGSETVVAYRK